MRCRTGTALGLPFDRILTTFGRVERGLERDDLHMRSMNAALWQVGWGYFLSNMIGAEAGLTPCRSGLGARALSRLTCAASDRSRRCAAARSLTGILPVTSLDLWQPGAGEAGQLAGRVAQRACSSRRATASGGRRWDRSHAIGHRQDGARSRCRSRPT